MRQKNLFANLFVLFATASLFGQNSIPTTSVATETHSKSSSSQAAYYIDPLPLHLNLILSLPPARDSATAAAELTELHRIEAVRTPAQIAQAQADDHEEDIFLFETVLGQGFTAEALPITASCPTVYGKRKARQAVYSRSFIIVHARIRLTARFTQSAHSTQSPRRTRAGILFPAICLPLLSSN
jgi:hypothetical protein